MILEKLKKKKEENRLHFYIYTTYNVLIFLLFAFLFVIIMNVVVSGGARETYIFNKRPTIVITGSMEPVIMVNSVVVLEPVNFNDLKEGDIIRYTGPQGFSIMHRIIHKNSTYVVTKGDANECRDSFPVLPQQVTGRVTEIHNECAKPLTVIFGRFEYDNMGGSVGRAMLGFLGIGLTISVMVTLFIIIFEMLTITKFFRKHGDELVDCSESWLSKIRCKEEELEIVNKYKESYKKSNVFKKIILMWKFRRWYNGLVNIEKEAIKTDKRLRTLNKWIN